jgi:UDP-N-acetyl-2-amino-2-deoxyglucuronate dehydrogenase
MDTLKFALIGCGRIGKRHAEHIISNGKLVAVCDIDITKAESFGKQYNVASYSSIEILLLREQEIDIVSICTPNGLHAEHTIKALNKGNHVLCEKPMGINVHECGEMIKAAERANKRLFIVKQNRFNPPVVAVKKLIDENKLGKIFTVQLNCFWNRNQEYYNSSDWKGTKKLDGGTLFTQFSHFIDLLYFMIGDVKEVHAFVGNLNHEKEIEFEDSGVVALKFHNGALGTIHYTVNSFQKNMEGSITIFAEKGTIKIGGQYLNELEYQVTDGLVIKDLPEGNPPNMYGQYIGSMSNHGQVYENIVDVLSNGGVMATNGFEGLKTVEIIDKILRAANEHK